MERLRSRENQKSCGYLKEPVLRVGLLLRVVGPQRERERPVAPSLCAIEVGVGLKSPSVLKCLRRYAAYDSFENFTDGNTVGDEDHVHHPTPQTSR